ncbi:MAG: hypothetical protein IT210_22485 [Armatimonadetes bacterium]|nr:hypothetical protein [Armatimonadota bacterium]
MYQGKRGVKAVHFKVDVHQGDLPELQAYLDDPRINVLDVRYGMMESYNEKWVLVIYEDV